MTAHDSNVIEANIPRIHWFGDPADDETSDELQLINKYFCTADDIHDLAMTAIEARHSAHSRAESIRQRALAGINFPSR